MHKPKPREKKIYKLFPVARECLFKNYFAQATENQGKLFVNPVARAEKGERERSTYTRVSMSSAVVHVLIQHIYFISKKGGL
jgi:hypothetical protein